MNTRHIEFVLSAWGIGLAAILIFIIWVWLDYKKTVKKLDQYSDKSEK